MSFAGRLAWTISITGALLALPQIARADDDLKVSADVSAVTGYASNPFSTTGDHLDSGYVQLEYKPQVVLTKERSVFTLDGDFRKQYYFRDYSGSTDYGANLAYLGTPAAGLTTHARMRYTSQIAGGVDLINSAIDPQQPPPTNSGTDLAVFGTRRSQRRFEFMGDAAYIANARDTWIVNGFYNQSSYDGTLAQGTHSGYGGGAGYSRKINEHLQLGAQASVSQYVYSGPLGQPRVYSLEATVSDQLNSRWLVSGALGASHSSRPTGGGSSVHPTGNVQLCRVGSRSNLCAALNQSVDATVGGTVTTTLALILYSYQLSEHDSLHIIGRYLSEGTGRGLVAINVPASSVKSYSATANFDRQLSRRLHFLATTQYRIFSRGVGNSPGDFDASLGISVRFGDM